MDALSYFLAKDLSAANMEIDKLQAHILEMEALHERCILHAEAEIDELLERLSNANYRCTAYEVQLQRAQRTINLQRETLIEAGLTRNMPRNLPATFRRVRRRLALSSESDSEGTDFEILNSD